MGIETTILSLGLGVMQYGQQRKAANARKKANQVANRASIRQSLRETQIKSARMRSFAQFAGVGQGTYSNTMMSQFGRTASDASMITQYGEQATNYELTAGLLGLVGSGLGGVSQASGSGVGGSNMINVSGGAGKTGGGFAVGNPMAGIMKGYGYY